ncbi:MAG: potassium channel family protein [Candidatus Saccharimonadales bacterium]
METFDKQIYKLVILAGIATMTTGTIVYHFAEHWSWLNSYYFSVVTLTTVGYGDFVPTTPFGKIFTTIYILVGVGIITTFITSIMRRQGSKMKQRQEKRKNSK